MEAASSNPSIGPASAVHRIDVTFTVPFERESSTDPPTCRLEMYKGLLNRKNRADPSSTHDTELPKDNSLVTFLTHEDHRHIRLVNVTTKQKYSYLDSITSAHLEIAMKVVTPLLEHAEFGFQTIHVGHQDALEQERNHEAILMMFRGLGEQRFPGKQVKGRKLPTPVDDEPLDETEICQQGTAMVYGLVPAGGR